MNTKLTEYIQKNNAGKETFCEMLFSLIDQKGFSDVDVYKKAGLDRKYFSKLRCDVNYKPKKKIVCALALALELDNATCKKLVKKADAARRKFSCKHGYIEILACVMQSNIFETFV